MNLESILLSENVIYSIYQNLDKLLQQIPELKLIINFNHKHPHHHLDVFNHTLLSLFQSPKDLTIRLALLFHDIGKPICFKEENGIRHYPSHGKYSSKIARQILIRLNYPFEYTDIICELIEKHDEPITKENIKENYDFCFILYQIQYCDALAHHPLKLDKRIKYLKETSNLLTNASLMR